MKNSWIYILGIFVLLGCTELSAQGQDDWFSTDCPEDIALGEEFGITAIPDTVSPAYKEAYCKYTKIDTPNGKAIHIFAQNEISNEQMIFARDLLAFYLEDFPGSQYGSDKSEVANKMADNGATLVMRNGYDGKYRLRIRGARGQPLYDEETIPVGTPEYLDTDNYRDASFEEILHLMHDNGIGIDIAGYDEGAMPDYQKEIRAALNNAHYKNKLWGHGNERRARWIAELKEEGSLTQEYLAAIVDSYYGLWGANKTRTTGIGGYVAKTRKAIAEKDPMGYALMEKYLNPYLTFNARIDSRFEGTFSLTFDPAVPYTHKSQYLVNATLTGSKNSNLTGNDQDNQLSGNSGRNILDGRGGNDSALFSGASIEYKISRSNNEIVVEDSVANRDGIVRLRNIETLEFADKTVTAESLLSPGASSEQAPQSRQKRILFESNIGDNVEVFVINADGTNPVNLSNHAGYDGMPAWTADGSQIIFASDRDAGEEGGNDVYIMNADGSNVTRITTDSGGYSFPTLSPDGKLIAFDASRGAENAQVWVMNADGSNVTRITHSNTPEGYCSWTPDSKRIGFDTFRDGPSEIYTVNADGSDPFRVTRFGAHVGDPRISPDGRKMTFETGKDGNSEIYVTNIDGSDPVRLTDNPADDRSPAISHDGKQVVFSSDRDGGREQFELFIMDIDGSNLRKIKAPGTANLYPTFAPPGE